MSREKTFDENVYKNAYNRSHYTNCSLRIKPEKAQKIADYCAGKGLSKNDFYVSAALYIIDNGIDLTKNADK